MRANDIAKAILTLATVPTEGGGGNWVAGDADHLELLIANAIQLELTQLRDRCANLCRIAAERYQRELAAAPEDSAADKYMAARNAAMTLQNAI